MFMDKPTSTVASRPSWHQYPSPGDLPNPGIEPRSPALQADSLPAEPQGKPKNPGVGSTYHLFAFSKFLGQLYMK